MSQIQMIWDENESYIHGTINKLATIKDPIWIAAFDLDDTIIHKYSKGKKLQLIDANVPDKIKELIKKKNISLLYSQIKVE